MGGTRARRRGLPEERWWQARGLRWRAILAYHRRRVQQIADYPTRSLPSALQRWAGPMVLAHLLLTRTRRRMVRRLESRSPGSDCARARRPLPFFARPTADGIAQTKERQQSPLHPEQ